MKPYKKIIQRTLALLLVVLCVTGNVAMGAQKQTTSLNLWLNMKGFSLLVGDYYTLIIHGAPTNKVKWKSTKKSVATVDKNGRVTAKKCGKTIIKAKYKKSVAKCAVTVREDNVKRNTYVAKDRLLTINKKDIKKYTTQQAMCTDDEGNVYLFRNRADGDTRIYKISNSDGTVKGLITSLQVSEGASVATQAPESTPVVSKASVSASPYETPTGNETSAAPESTNVATTAAVGGEPERNVTLEPEQGVASTNPNEGKNSDVASGGAIEETSSVPGQWNTPVATESPVTGSAVTPVVSGEAVASTVVTEGAVAQTATPEAIVSEEPSFYDNALVGTFSCLGHANDAAYKGDDSRSGKGLYISTGYNNDGTEDRSRKPAVVQLSMEETYNETTGKYEYQYKKAATYDIVVPYKTKIGDKTYKGKKKVVAASIAYDEKSKYFIIRETGSDLYYVGYFKKTSKSKGVFVTRGTFRLQDTVNGGNLDYYGRQGVAFKDGILYVCKSGHYNDSPNNSLILRYDLGNLKKYKNKKGTRILFHKQKILISSLSQSRRYEFDYKKGDSYQYKFEIEGAGFIGNRLAFITIENTGLQGAKSKNCLYVE